MKRTHLICAFIFLSIFIIPAYAGETEDMFIPQSSPVYDDFYLMAEAGLIKSVPSEQFMISPMTEYDAAGYVMEAAVQYAAAGGQDGVKASAAAKFKKYYDIYRKKAFEIYGKTMEMRKKLANIEELMKNADLKSFDEVLDEAKGTMFDVENEFAKTTFRGVPPFKVMGMLQVRWQDVESFGISRVHQTSFGGTVMSLWTEGIVSPDVSFKLNLNFEKPADEAEKGDVYAEYWGTGTRFMDKYTINLVLWGWQINTGFFWEDITPFIAKGTLSDRPALFDRDPYVLEETTKGHFENAFLHSFVKRGDIWSKHGFFGVEFLNTALPGGGQFKVMGGKAEQFDEQYDKLFLYEFAGRATQPFDFGFLTGGQVAFNFYNRSNELAEIQTLAPAATDNFPLAPYGYIQSCTIYGGDLKLKLFEIFNISSELEMGDYYGYLPKGYLQYNNFFPPKYHQQGPAFYASAAIKDAFMVDLELKYTRIDPNYVAPASALIDTTYRTLNTTGPVETADLSWVTYAGDPTLLYNNSSRVDLRAAIELPAQLGFLNLSYGSASQITGTSNTVTVDHFIFGNRLTGPMWWHLFFSQYGYTTNPSRDRGIFAYNAPDHPNAYIRGTGKRYLTTDKWLSNKELIKSKSPTDPTVDDVSIKYTSNVGVELKFAIHKLLATFGIQSNNIFLELYGELNTLKPGSDLMPTFDPDTLFSQNIMNAFIIWNVTRKSSLMFDYAVERWTTRHSWVGAANIPIDYYDQNFGVGFDYDFAPRTSIFLRAKKFIHEDTVLKEMHRLNPAILDQSFDGWYMGLEIKNFF